MTNYIGKLTDHDLYMANKIAERTGSTSAKVLKDFNDFKSGLRSTRARRGV